MRHTYNGSDAYLIEDIRAKIEAVLIASEMAIAVQDTGDPLVAAYRRGFAAGVACDPMTVYPDACTCAGCQAQTAANARRNAYAALTEATYALLAPSSFAVPPFVELMRRANDEHARNALWAHWKRMLDVAEVYITACQADGVEPDWRGVLWPGEAA